MVLVFFLTMMGDQVAGSPPMIAGAELLAIAEAAGDAAADDSELLEPPPQAARVAVASRATAAVETSLVGVRMRDSSCPPQEPRH
jgi:hypothetical protein